MLRLWQGLQLQTAGPHVSHDVTGVPLSAISPCCSRCKKPADLRSRGSVNRFLRARKDRRGMKKEAFAHEEGEYARNGDGNLMHSGIAWQQKP